MQTKKVILKIEGMSCGHCEKAVHGVLAGIAGVADISVSLKEGTASFTHDPALAPPETIRAAIREEGYDVAD